MAEGLCSTVESRGRDRLVLTPGTSIFGAESSLCAEPHRVELVSLQTDRLMSNRADFPTRLTVKIFVLICTAVALLMSAVAQAEAPLPSAGRNVLITDGQGRCLVALGDAGTGNSTAFPGTTAPAENPMDVALSTVPGTGDASAVWVGLVDCAAWNGAYGVSSLAEYYNENMATWWRPDTAGRLRSWVQPYACLDLPGGVAPPSESYWLWACTAGRDVPGNTFTYSATETTLKSDYSVGSGSSEECLVADLAVKNWTGKDNTSFPVHAVKLGACTDEAAKGWTIEEMAWQTYPYPTYSDFELADPYAPFDVFICAGDQAVCNASGAVWERSAVYHAYTSATEGNFSSSFTPFSMSTSGGFPLSVRVYYKWSSSPPLDPSQENAVSVMALNQSLISNVTGHAAASGNSPYAQFEVGSDAYVTVLFTGAYDLTKDTKPRLALFIDPMGEPFSDLSGCTRSSLCDSRAVGKRQNVRPFFIGPGFYDSSTFNSEACSFISDLPSHVTGSAVDVYAAGGARLNCPFVAAFATDTTASEVHLDGPGVFDANGLNGDTLGEVPNEQIPALTGAAPALVKACAATITMDGTIVMNTRPRGGGSLVANSPWDCGADSHSFYYKANSPNVALSHVKQVAGHWGTADGFDVGSNSTIEDSFIEANDDSIKMIGTDQVFKNITIWQNAIGWPIECGWGQAPERSNVRVENVDIHLINHYFDKYCCSDKDSGYNCNEQESKPNYTCQANPAWGYSSDAAACDDNLGKQAVIGCLNGVAGPGTNWSNFSVSDVTIRNPKMPSSSESYNQIQRVFAVGITTAPYRTPTCPENVQLNEFHLSDVMSLPPKPDVSITRSRFYVNAAPNSSMGLGDGKSDSKMFTVDQVYENCSDPIPGHTAAEAGCTTELNTVCESPSDTACYQKNGNHPDQIKVPEPSAGMLGFMGLLSLVGLRRLRAGSPGCGPVGRTRRV